MKAKETSFSCPCHATSSRIRYNVYSHCKYPPFLHFLIRHLAAHKRLQDEVDDLVINSGTVVHEYSLSFRTSMLLCPSRLKVQIVFVTVFNDDCYLRDINIDTQHSQALDDSLLSTSHEGFQLLPVILSSVQLAGGKGNGGKNGWIIVSSIASICVLVDASGSLASYGAFIYLPEGITPLSVHIHYSALVISLPFPTHSYNAGLRKSNEKH